MNYFLVLGILYQKFKHPAQISISSGDRLIDCFELNQDLPPARLQYDHLHTPHIEKYKLKLNKLSSLCDVPNFYKVYKLDISEIGNNFTVKVQNSNNNYTNGFMTKSSLIMLPIITLFPETMTKNNCEPLATMIDRLWETYEKVIARYETDKRFTGLPCEDDDTILNITNNKHIPSTTWPSLNWLKVKSNSTSLDNGLYRANSWLGGDVELHIDVRKKYGLKYLHTSGTKTHGVWNFFNMYYLIPSAKNLINTYNENQRSDI